MKRKACSCVLLLILVLFISGCRDSLYMKDKGVEEVSEVAGETVTAPEPEPTPIPVRKEYTREEINALTQGYKIKWLETEKKIKSLAISEDANGVKRYSEKNILQKIEIGQDTYGTRDLNYEREYYFEDNALYFARLTSDAGEMRLYFHDQQLIRLIDEKNNAYDNGEVYSDFEVFEIKLLPEADTLAEEFEADKVILNSYVAD